MTHPTLRRLPPDFVDRLRDLLATVRAAQTLLASESDADQLTRVCRLAARQTGAAGALLYVLDADRNDLRVAAAVGEPYAPLVGAHLGRTGLPGFALDDGTPLAVADLTTVHSTVVRSPDEVRDRTGVAARSQLVAPVMVFGVAAGVIEVRDAPGERGFSPEDVEVVVELAHVAAAAVEAHRGERLLAGMFAAVLPGALAGRALDEELLAWIDEVRSTPGFRRELALAAKLRALAKDERGLAMVEEIVDAVLRGRP